MRHRRPTFRVGNDDVFFVEPHAVMPVGRAPAEAFIDEAFADPDNRSALAQWLGVAPEQLDGPKIREQAIALLANGVWRAVELDEIRESGRPVFPRFDPVDPVDPVEPRRDPEKPKPPPPPVWLAITVVDEDGHGYAGTTWTLTTPDGDDMRVTLDDRSTWRADDMAVGGSCYLRFVSHPTRSDLLPDFAGIVADDAWIEEQAGAAVGLASGRAHRVVVVRGRTEIVLLDEDGRPEKHEWCEVRVGDRLQKRLTDDQGMIVVCHPRSTTSIEARFPMLADDAAELEHSKPLPTERT